MSDAFIILVAFSALACGFLWGYLITDGRWRKLAEEMVATAVDETMKRSKP